MHIGLLLGLGTLASGGGAPAFDPFDVGNAPTAAYRGPNYAVPGGVGTWTATVGTNLTQATAPPAAVSGAPDFEASTDNPLNNAVAYSTIIGTGSASGFAVVDLESITSTETTNVWINQAIWYDPLAYQALTVYTDGGLFYAAIYFYNGGIKKAVVQLPGGTGRCVIAWQMVDKGAGKKLFVRVNGGAWVTGDAITSVDDQSGTLRVGSTGLLTLDGIIHALGFYTSGKDDTFFANVDAWAAATYP